MDCCDYARIADTQFGAKHARRDATRYRKKGPDHTTQALLALIRATGMSRVTLLDIGAGIGVIHQELLGETVASATHAEASPAYSAEAAREARARGHIGRVRFIQGDATELGSDLPDADLVTLDRVICCFPDWGRLVTHSAGKARQYYGFSVPRARWSVRALVAFQNAKRRLSGSAFRTFVHSPEEIGRELVALGFRRHDARDSFGWHSALYLRKE